MNFQIKIFRNGAREYVPNRPADKVGGAVGLIDGLGEFDDRFPNLSQDRVSRITAFLNFD